MTIVPAGIRCARARTCRRSLRHGEARGQPPYHPVMMVRRLPSPVGGDGDAAARLPESAISRRSGKPGRGWSTRPCETPDAKAPSTRRTGRPGRCGDRPADVRRGARESGRREAKAARSRSRDAPRPRRWAPKRLGTQAQAAGGCAGGQGAAQASPTPRAAAVKTKDGFIQGYNARPRPMPNLPDQTQRPGSNP